MDLSSNLKTEMVISIFVCHAEEGGGFISDEASSVAPGGGIRCNTVEEALNYHRQSPCCELFAPACLLDEVIEKILMAPSLMNRPEKVYIYGENPPPEEVRRGFIHGITDWIFSNDLRIADGLPKLMHIDRPCEYLPGIRDEEPSGPDLTDLYDKDSFLIREDRLYPFSEITDGMWEYSNGALRFSDSFYRTLKWGREVKITRDNLERYIHSEELHRAEKILCPASVRSNESFNSTFRVLSGNGKWQWFRARGKATGSGESFSVIGLLNSVDHYIKAQNKLREVNGVLKAIMKSAPLPVFSLDNQGKVQYLWNQAVEDLLGWKREEVIGKPYPAIPPDKIEEYLEHIRTISRGESIRGKEVERQRKDGSTITFSIYTSPLYDDENNVSGNVVILVDMTEIKKIRASIEEHHERYQAIFNANLDGLIILDENWNIVDSNPAACRLYGFKPGEMKGMDILQLTDEKEKIQPEKLSMYMKMVFNGEEIFGETTARRNDGKSFVAETKAICVELAGIKHMLAIIRDITGAKRIQNEREMLIKQLEIKNAELERYAYIVSHDLRGPLITIRGFIGYLKSDVQKGKLDRILTDLDRINQAAVKLEKLMNDLLELAKVNEIVSMKDDVNLTGVFKEAALSVSAFSERKDLIFEIQDGMPVIVGDLQRFKEAAFNLLENAVKFSGKERSLKVLVSAEFNNHFLILKIKDNGIGINPRYHARIFGLFDKLDQKSEGTGVGLAIVRRIIQLHGGSIWVESEGYNKGSTFIIKFPYGKD